MAGSDNQPIMTNGYCISEWDPGVPILDNDKYENGISYTMDQVYYDEHVDPDEEYT